MFPTDIGSHCVSFLLPEEGHRLQRVCRLWHAFLGTARNPVRGLGLWHRKMICVRPYHEFKSTYYDQAVCCSANSGVYLSSNGTVHEYQLNGFFRNTTIPCDRLWGVSDELVICGVRPLSGSEKSFVIRRLDGKDHLYQPWVWKRQKWPICIAMNSHFVFQLIDNFLHIWSLKDRARVCVEALKDMNISDARKVKATDKHLVITEWVTTPVPLVRVVVWKITSCLSKLGAPCVIHRFDAKKYSWFNFWSLNDKLFCITVGRLNHRKILLFSLYGGTLLSELFIPHLFCNELAIGYDFIGAICLHVDKMYYTGRRTGLPTKKIQCVDLVC